jgi:hypothetical protein
MEAKLIVIRGKANKGEVALNLPTTIGRSRDSDLTVAHPMVSRRHCEIFEADGALKIRDLGSLNGTFVNGERVTEAEVPPDAEITVGPLTFRAEYSQGGEDEMPAFDEAGDEVAFEALEEPAEEEAATPAKAKPEAGIETEELEPDFTTFEEAVADDLGSTDEEPKKKAKPKAEEVEADEDIDFAVDDEEAPPSKKGKQPVDEDEEFEVAEPPKKGKKPTAKKPVDDELVEMEDLEETAAFDVDLTEAAGVSDEEETHSKPPSGKKGAKKAAQADDEEPSDNGEAEEQATAEDEEADGEPAKKKGWWPFKRGGEEDKKAEAKKKPAKPAKAAKNAPPKDEEPEEEAEAEEEPAPPPKKAAAKKPAKPEKPAKPAKKGGGRDLDLDDLALAAVQGDEADDGADKSVSQAEEEDLDDFLKGLQ